MQQNLNARTHTDIKLGKEDSWPRPGETAERDIFPMVSAAVGAVLERCSARTVRGCYNKLIVYTHPDRYLMAGARVYYAALACTAMLNRCKAVVEGQDAPSIHPMPDLLITPFRPEEAVVHPPSRFEWEAARVARTRDFPGAS